MVANCFTSIEPYYMLFHRLSLLFMVANYFTEPHFVLCCATSLGETRLHEVVDNHKELHSIKKAMKATSHLCGVAMGSDENSWV